MNTFLTILGLILLSVISQYIEKKSREQSEKRPKRREGEGNATAPAGPAGGGPFDWQRQLRDLLEGKGLIPPAAPPPVERVPPSMPPPRAARKPVQRELSEQDVRLPSRLTESSTAYDRAAHLQHAVHERMRSIEEATEHARPSRPRSRARRHTPPRVATLLRKRQTLRDLILASAILGRPKALE